MPSTGQNIRFNGRLFGNINGINLTGLLVDLIAITKDGRVYAIIRNPPPGLAHSLKILTPFVDAIGWSLGYKKAKGVPNGFNLIGDRFTRNVVISFDTGKIIFFILLPLGIRSFYFCFSFKRFFLYEVA